MGYQVIKRYGRRDGSVVWRVRWESYATGERVQRDIPKKEIHKLGFNPSMTLEEAQAHVKTLQEESWAQFQRRRKQQHAIRWLQEEAAETAFLPADLCEQFERGVLFRLCWNEIGPTYRQLLCYWRTAKRIIRSLNLPPGEWQDERTAIYSYFIKRQWSLSYAQKVIRVMNLWGQFYSKKQNLFFELVSKPTAESAARIHEAYFRKRPRGLVSAPMSWHQLKRARPAMVEEEWNWLYLSLWFGLRPSELKRLDWKIEKYRGSPVLAVFQHKLVRLPPDQRWKFIPILFRQQRQGIEIMKKGVFKKPTIATIQKHANPQATLRAGRKGFVALMWEMGKHPKSLSYRWLGHKSVRTTDNHYTQGMQQACEF